MVRKVIALLLLTLVAAAAWAEGQPGFPSLASASEPRLATVIPQLAEQALSQYTNPDRDGYLDDVFRLQLAAGRYADAVKALEELRALRIHDPNRSVLILPYEVYAQAKLQQMKDGTSYDSSFRQSYKDLVGPLDNETAAYQLWWVFGTPLFVLQGRLDEALGREKGEDRASLQDTLALVRSYLALNVYRSFQPLLDRVQAEDDGRRYIVEKDRLVETSDGARVCVLVMRPRSGAARLPALMEFSIYANGDRLPEARLSAAHGYVGVVGLTRGKGCSPDKPVPIEHDGADADAVIDWIAHQAWSDGRVGMFGGSYDGFAQWAAAKRIPKALKALMPSVSFAPGIDFPMDGNIFMNYGYPWPFYTTDNKRLDDAVYGDRERWQRLDHDWYVSGRAYGDLDKIDGTPNPFWDRWVSHPDYDSYWKDVKPYGEDFAKIGIPVLTTTGYYDSGQIGALYYFRQHYLHDPQADHYLVIGPYDHVRGQRGTISPTGSTLGVIRGYALDPVAQIEILKLRYEWFDYVFKAAPKPAILQDKVNYEVMGANVWKHAPSLAAMANQTLKLHLSVARSNDAYRLSEAKPTDDSFITQTVDLADRSDVAQFAPRGGLIDQALDDWDILSKAPNIAHAIEFMSDPLTQPLEVSGLLSGQVDFTTNKKDFDFSVTLFELTPKGEYFQLSYYWARASYVQDRSRRQPLVPDQRQELAFESGRLTSRALQSGSRLVVVLAIIKQPGEQINYGTGKDVSDETIADAKAPLRIKWYDDSYVDIPIWK